MHLATGDRYPTLACDFCINRNTIANFIPEVCEAIKLEFIDEVMDTPTDADTRREIAEEFKTKWNVPHALRALDGKNIRIRKPPKSGSTYHNYKGFFSVVLMALVDADYKFLYTDVGRVGHQYDCKIYNHSELKAALENGDLNLPDPDPLMMREMMHLHFVRI